MFKLGRVLRSLGDCTCVQEVYFNKPYILKDFINDVVSKKCNEWGHIYIDSWITGFEIEYKSGDILKDSIPPEMLDLEIMDISANGGYSCMDYAVKLKGLKI